MLILRSLLFNVAFYAIMIASMICLMPLFLAPRRTMLRAVQAWARANVRLLDLVAGTKVEVRGREHIPAGGLLVAAKHQSFLETFVLITMFDDPAYVLKRELTLIPVFGWFVRKIAQVPIDRGGRTAARALKKRARLETGQGRQVIIFPEGTRRPPGAPPAYKSGVVHLYASCRVPCLPVALNTGLYWPRRSFLRRPGKAVIEILPPLPPDLPRDEVLPILEERIETASNRLLADGQAACGVGAMVQDPEKSRIGQARP